MKRSTCYEEPPMRKVQPLVDRFVNDLLGAIRAAAIAQVAASGAPARVAAPRAGRKPRAPLHRPKARGTGRKSRVAPATRETVAVATAVEQQDAVAAEITDPMRLLDVASGKAPSAVASGQPDPAAIACEVCAQPEAAPPEPPAERKDTVVVSLRPNETVVRATAAGLVIRRARG